MAESFDLLRYKFKVLEPGDDYSFDCGDPAITDFFIYGALPNQEEMLGITYFFYDRALKAIAFFTVLNDTLATDSFRDSLPEGKRYRYYPAIKIGRLGVDKEYQGKNVGGQMLKFIRELFVVNRKIDFRFMTVDAYNKPEVLKFYTKNGFSLLTEKDAGKPTRTMKYDLKPFADTLAQSVSSYTDKFNNR